MESGICVVAIIRRRACRPADSLSPLRKEGQVSTERQFRFGSRDEVRGAAVATQDGADDIRFVIHLGDLVQDWDAEEQWQVADKAHRLLDGVGPYTVVQGNHEMPVKNKERLRDLQIFPDCEMKRSGWRLDVEVPDRVPPFRPVSRRR